MNLNRVERLMLSNQYKILEALYPKEAKDYARRREAIERGYELNYDWDLDYIYDGNDVMTKEECQEVFKVLGLFSALKHSYEKLADKSGIDERDIKFPGFDGNNETKQMAYARYLVEKEQRYGDLKIGDAYNSHFPSLGRYRAMVEVWEGIEDRYQLSKEEILRIVSRG